MIMSVLSGACGPRACVRGDSSSSVVFSASASLTPRKSMSPKILLVLSLLCITVYSAPPRRTAAQCLSNHAFEYTPNRGGRGEIFVLFWPGG